MHYKPFELPAAPAAPFNQSLQRTRRSVFGFSLRSPVVSHLLSASLSSGLGITMRIAIPSLIFAFMLLLAGCGFLFGPGYSMHDKSYFADAPHIALHTNTATYALRWQYGTMGFFFQPRAKIVGGQLCFSLQGTSSSGSLRGRYSEIPITDPKMIQVLRSGGAFWLEPDGTKVSLVLTNL